MNTIEDTINVFRAINRFTQFNFNSYEDDNNGVWTAWCAPSNAIFGKPKRDQSTVLLSGIDDVDELWFQRRSTDQKAVNVFLGRQFFAVLGRHGACTNIFRQIANSDKIYGKQLGTR